jgi:peptide chain release factor subunit 1
MDPGAKAKNKDRIWPVSEIDLHALAEEKGEVDDFLTIYLTVNIRDDRPQIASRLKTMAKAMPHELEEAFSKTRIMAESGLTTDPIKGERGRIIFASEQRAILQVYRLGVEMEPLVVWDRSPFLLPLAKLSNDYQDYCLLLLDSQEARLFLIRSDFLQEKKKISIDLMNKHKKGGWSQMRYNRLRMGSIKSFLSQVIDDLQKWEDLSKAKGLVVAGPGEAKGQLVEMLPPELKKLVLDVVSISMETSPGDLVRLGDEIVRGDRTIEKAISEKLRESVLKGQLAAYGLDEVGEALEQGRVNYLLISKDFALPGMICKSCHHIHAKGERCPTCGGEMAALQLESLLEMAQRSGAKVVLAEDEFLESIGHVGALLRY